MPLISSRLSNLWRGCVPPKILMKSHSWHKALTARLSMQVPNVFGPVVPIFECAKKFPSHQALKDCHGDYTFQGLYKSSYMFAEQISDSLKGKTQERVAFLCHNDASYIIAQWACWMSGQIAVPITSHHPPPLQEYYISNSEASILVTTSDFVDNVQPVADNTNAQILVLEKELCNKASECNDADSSELPQLSLESAVYQNSDALMIYTSGTTGNPKGVVISHSNIHAQVSSLQEAWGWSENDSILHILPLHHIHGIVNVLLCSLASGARCIMLPKFDAATVWDHLLAEGIPKTSEVNVFMAVPTVYVKLLEEYDKIVANDPGAQERIYKICSEKIRLMVSGSAPLPVPLFKRWEHVTGHKLLERFGMSETGMVLSNPLHGKRKPGFVGNPLPSVEVQIARQDSNNKYEVLVYGSAAKGTTVLSNETTIGDLLVKGPSVFKGYWRLPEATKKEFTEDGWFKTGDTAQYTEGAYKIQGRTSVDIIKTGGYKVSALEIETHLLGHPDILDCAVVGLPDPTWGQKVAVVIVTRGGRNMTLLQLREFGKKCMAPYAIPTIVKIVEDIPKNAMGKVNKKELIKTVFP